jgi:hypothetical protein
MYVGLNTAATRPVPSSDYLGTYHPETDSLETSSNLMIDTV